MWQFYIICGLLVLVYWKYLQQSKYNLPPGPWNLPLIGSLLQVLHADAKQPVVAFQKLAQKYGNILYLRLGFVPTVVINGHKLIAKIANLDDFSELVDENDDWILEKSEGLNLGLFFGKKKFWAATTTFTLKLLKKYGFGLKNFLERLIVDQLEEFIVDLRMEMIKTNGVIHIDTQFSALFVNNIWTLITGNPFQSKNQLQKMVKMSNDYVTSGKCGGGIAGLYPGLIKYFPGFTGFNKHKKTCYEFRCIVKDEISNRRMNGSYKSSAECFLDEFMQNIDETNDFEKVYSTIFTDLNLVAVLQDLIMGGSETCAHLMKFFIRYMLYYPEIQNKIHQELDEVLGDKRVSIEDIPGLKYTQAAMYELLRIANVIPATPRRTFNDIKFEGYDIPSGTVVICNLSTANLDESVWERPNDFRVERFLDENGVLINIEKLYVFGLGKRTCIGNRLAKTNLLLTICTLMQEFRFEVDDTKKMPLVGDDILGFTKDTPAYHVRIKTRR